MIALTQSALTLLACHPDVQDRLLAEISAHPQAHLSDLVMVPENELPFLTAVIMEVHRFRPAVNIVNHSPLKDDVYDGYRISKGSQVGCNVW
jgi:cytochrome P450